jgi:hypothetical protein
MPLCLKHLTEKHLHYYFSDALVNQFSISFSRTPLLPFTIFNFFHTSVILRIRFHEFQFGFDPLKCFGMYRNTRAR